MSHHGCVAVERPDEPELFDQGNLNRHAFFGAGSPMPVRRHGRRHRTPNGGTRSGCRCRSPRRRRDRRRRADRYALSTCARPSAPRYTTTRPSRKDLADDLARGHFIRRADRKPGLREKAAIAFGGNLRGKAAFAQRLSGRSGRFGGGHRSAPECPGRNDGRTGWSVPTIAGGHESAQPRLFRRESCRSNGFHARGRRRFWNSKREIEDEELGGSRRRSPS